MKINVDLNRLVRARESIGAGKAEIGEIIPLRIITGNPIEARLIEEGSIILGDTELENVIFPAGLSAIGNTQGLLHIYHPFMKLEDLDEIPVPKPKFHVMHCKTLTEMIEGERFNRYVFTASHQGLFKIEPLELYSGRELSEEILVKLTPCRNCLMDLNYDNYKELSGREKNEMVNNFDLGKFLENYKPIFRCLPLFTPESFPDGNYTSDWAKISEEKRLEAGWTCSCCRVELEKNRGLLHVHHRDGNRGNNVNSNLEVICVLCHKKRPNHGRMYVKPNEIRRLNNLKTEQNLPEKCITCRITQRH